MFSVSALFIVVSTPIRAVFKWLSKVITWLRLLCLVIGLKDSRQVFNQREAKPKPIAPCTHDFSRTSSKLQVIARNCDWLIALFVPVVIGQSNCFGFGFSTVIWKPLYCNLLLFLPTSISWAIFQLRINGKCMKGECIINLKLLGFFVLIVQKKFTATIALFSLDILFSQYRLNDILKGSFTLFFCYLCM